MGDLPTLCSCVGPATNAELKTHAVRRIYFPPGALLVAKMAVVSAPVVVAMKDCVLVSVDGFNSLIC